jgi:hypothetical protein
MLHVPASGIWTNVAAMGGAAASGALDSYTTGLTGAWSMHRTLLSSYGGSRFTNSSGNVSALFDQTGAGSRDFTSGAGARPAVSTVSGFDCADFTLNTHVLDCAATVATLINNNAGWIVWIGVVDTVPAQSLLLWNKINNTASISILQTTNRFQAYNNDGTVDVTSGAGTAITLGSIVLLTWRHEGGNINAGVNGGTETSTASGNTTSMTDGFELGKVTSFGFDGKFLELYTYNSVPSSGDRTSIINQAKTFYGIV